jgi:hypothetical protein
MSIHGRLLAFNFPEKQQILWHTVIFAWLRSADGNDGTGELNFRTLPPVLLLPCKRITVGGACREVVRRSRANGSQLDGESHIFLLSLQVRALLHFMEGHLFPYGMRRVCSMCDLPFPWGLGCFLLQLFCCMLAVCFES